MTREAAVPIQAIIFDLDGTLYAQRRVRARMLLELAGGFFGDPRGCYKVGRFLLAYRRAQEELRRLDAHRAKDQLWLACQKTGTADQAWASRIVDEWMDQRPLRFLSQAIRPGLTTFLAKARRRGIKLGLCSDYPAERKLHALGLSGAFDVVVSAQDPAIDCFKPNPAGLLSVMSELGVRPDKAAYVGDRTDVDGETARRAGVQAYILSSTTQGADCIGVHSFAELGRRMGIMEA